MYKSRIRRLEARVAALESVPAPRPVRIEVSGMSVGKNIKARRLALGMTQENLAQAVGLGRSMVAQIERGSKSASIQLGAEIAKVLQCDLNDLVSEVGGDA